MPARKAKPPHEMHDCDPEITTVGQVKKFLWQFAHTARGAKCPACQRRVKIYKPKLNGDAVRALTTFYRVEREGWAHVSICKSDANAARAIGLCGWFGLLDERLEQGVTTGEWRVTKKGEKFLYGEACEKYIAVYNKMVLDRKYLNSEDRDARITIEQAAGEHFDMDEVQLLSPSKLNAPYLTR